MKFHIIKNGERVKDILFTYSLTIDELKENNRHIRSWNELIPGTKLKIPVIPESVDQDVMQMEPFIEDYYPQNKEHYNEDFDDAISEDESKDIIDTTSETIINEKPCEDVRPSGEVEVVKEEVQVNKKYKYKTNYVYYYPYFHPYYGYIMVPYCVKK